MNDNEELRSSCLQEIGDRRNRSLHLILYGLDDSPQSDNIARGKIDQIEINNLFGPRTSFCMEAGSFKISRIGSLSLGKAFNRVSFNKLSYKDIGTRNYFFKHFQS